MVIIPDDWYRFFIFNNRKIDVTLNLNDQIRGGVHDQRAMARSARSARIARKGQKRQKQPKAAEQQKEQDKEQQEEEDARKRRAGEVSVPLKKRKSATDRLLDSINSMIHDKNSSDLSFGRRPTSKSDEFLSWIILVIEILRCENMDIGCE